MSKQRRSKSNSRKALAAALALALVPSLAHAATGDWTGSSGATTPRVPITPAICTTETVMLPSDAAAWLKNGSCEDDEPSRIHESRCRAQPLGGSTSGLTQD